jgi:hypothetical protein
MAEAYLYGNLADPQLPFDSVLPSLSWLSNEVEKYSTQSLISFEVIINILLVFGCARTSALLVNLTTDFYPFITRLNDALVVSHQPSFRLEVEEFYMGDWVFRHNNPRFIRKHRLTPREVGQNLDIFSAGNIDSIADDEEKIYIQIYEIESWTPVTAEVVLTRCLGSHDERLSNFTDTKVKLFNGVFEKLGLRYRFEWFVGLLPQNAEEVMTSSVPPSPEWWSKNWIYIAMYSVGRRSHLRNIFERYEQHWPVITAFWQFHRLNQVWMLHDDHFRIRVEAIFNTVSNHIARDISIDINTVRLKLAKLDAERRVVSERFRESRHGIRSAAWRYMKGLIVTEFRYWIFESKLPLPRVEPFRGLDCPPMEGHYWLSLARRVATQIRYVVFG